MTDRIYIVKDTTNNTEQYIEAASQAEAVRIVTAGRYVAKVATTVDLMRVMQSGGTVLTRMHQQPGGPVA